MDGWRWLLYDDEGMVTTEAVTMNEHLATSGSRTMGSSSDWRDDDDSQSSDDAQWPVDGWAERSHSFEARGQPTGQKG